MPKKNFKINKAREKRFLICVDKVSMLMPVGVKSSFQACKQKKSCTPVWVRDFQEVKITSLKDRTK
jgi:hypothetical protein